MSNGMIAQMLKDGKFAETKVTAQEKVNKFMKDSIDEFFKGGKETFTQTELIENMPEDGYKMDNGECVKVSSANIKKAIEFINKDETFAYKVSASGKSARNGYKISVKPETTTTTQTAPTPTTQKKQTKTKSSNSK